MPKESVILYLVRRQRTATIAIVAHAHVSKRMKRVVFGLFGIELFVPQKPVMN